MQSDYSHIKTDEDLMEIIPHGSDAYPFKFYDEVMSMFDFKTIDWHWHAEFEFVYIEEGEVNISIGTDTFRIVPGQGLFINTRELHYFHTETDAVIPNFLFSASFIAPQASLLYQKYILPVISSGISYLLFDPGDPDSQDLLSVIRHLITLQRSGNTDEMETFIDVCRIWKYLGKLITSSAPPAAPRHDTAAQARLQLMMQFIQDSYSSYISLEDIAAHASVSKSTALNLFKKYLHTTPVDYLVSYRLNRAASLLSNTDKRINTISGDVGFVNVDYFCRSFKKHYLVTPTEYRRMHTN